MNSRSSKRSNVEDLLREGAWVRALARRLVVDDSAADDVVQDTWVAAMRSAPVEREQLRPWLARVVRNFATAARRTDANRAAREAEAARREPARSELETAERLEAQRALVDALEALAEPYRTTLMRRYFDGLSSSDIALADGIPAATVRWRIAHGVEELRKRLDRRYGDRASWALAFLPLTRTPETVALTAAGVGGVTTFGILAMSTATRATIAAIVLLTASVGIWIARDGHEPVDHRVSADTRALKLAEPTPPTGGSATELVGADDRDAREAADAARADSPSAPITPALGPVHIDGRFVDASGNGIPGVRIVEPLREDGEQVVSNSRGNFVLPMGKMWAAVVLPFEARAEGWAAHFSEVSVTPGATLHRGPIVLKPGGTVTGKVIDEMGAPVAGARVLTTSPVLTDSAETLQRTGPKLDVTPGRRQLFADTRSDEDGGFRLEGVPAELLRVWAGHTDKRWTFSEPIEVPADGFARDLVLTLASFGDEDRIEGIVLAPYGEPVAQAIVSYSFHAPDGSYSNSTRSGADGRFEIPVVRKVPHDLQCTAPRNQWPGVALADVEPGARSVVLQMREGTPIDLFVTDEKGDPVEAFEYMVRAGTRGMTTRESAYPEGRAVVKMPAMQFTVEVSAKGRAKVVLGPIDPASPPKSLKCTLAAVPGLRGRVMDGDKPVAGAKLGLHKLVNPDERVDIEGFPSRMQGSSTERDKTDEEGRFLIAAQQAGSFALLCEAQGFALAEISPLDVDPRAERDEFVVQLTRGGVIEGRVLTPEGRDAAGLIVGLTRFDCRPQTKRVGPDGRFRFENLSAGDWRVTRADHEILPNRNSSSMGSASGPSPFQSNCTVEDNRVTPFDLDLREGLDVVFVGRIAVNAKPATGWTVMLTPEDTPHFGGEPPSGIVSASGEVRITLPRPAPYRLDLVPPSETGAPLRITRRIEIRGGENPFAAELECGTLAGVVTVDRNRHQLSCASVDTGEWSYSGILTWDENGRFRLSHLPIGQARLRMVDTRAEGGWQPVADKHVDVTRAAVATVELP